MPSNRKPKNTIKSSSTTSSLFEMDEVYLGNDSETYLKSDSEISLSEYIPDDADLELLKTGQSFNLYLNFNSPSSEESLSETNSLEHSDDSDNDDIVPSDFVSFKNVNLRQINRDLRAFVQDSAETTFSFPPMDKSVRKHVKLIGEVYKLDCIVSGKARNRFLTFFKTSKTKKPQNFSVLDDLVSANLFRSAKPEKGKYMSKKYMKKHPKEVKAKASNIPKEGSIVGISAPAIDEGNVGNKLLRKMGWNPGFSLGAKNEGITEPINVTFKNSKKGIGS